MAVPAFLEIHLPPQIERSAKGGPRFSTTIFPSDSGKEQRNANWSRTRGLWTVGSGVRDLVVLNTFRALFYVCRGRATGFRFKDWTDFRIIGPQAIGIGDGAKVAWQVYKRYPVDSYFFDRPITKLVAATYHVYVDGTELVEGAGAGKFTIDVNTGIITLGTAAADTKVVAFRGDFDVPVRFDTDQCDELVTWIKDLGDGIEPVGVAEWDGMPLVEIRSPAT